MYDKSVNTAAGAICASTIANVCNADKGIFRSAGHRSVGIASCAKTVESRI